MVLSLMLNVFTFPSVLFESNKFCEERFSIGGPTVMRARFEQGAGDDSCQI